MVVKISVPIFCLKHCVGNGGHFQGVAGEVPAHPQDDLSRLDGVQIACSVIVRLALYFVESCSRPFKRTSGSMEEKGEYENVWTAVQILDETLQRWIWNA